MIKFSQNQSKASNIMKFERLEKIMELLRESKSASISKIAKHTDSSEATVRRDLSDLEKNGLLRRTHGGAVIFESSNDETSALVRMTQSKDKKEKIATLALSVIGEGKTFFFDSSSTVCSLAKIFNLKYKTIVTTGLNCALTLSEKEDLNVIIPGGNVMFNSNSILGSLTLKNLTQYNSDIAVFSCAGLCGHLVTEATFEQSELKKLAHANSSVRVLLVDSSKFDKKLPFTFGKTDDFDYIITDCRPPYSTIENTEKAKIVY